MAFEPNGHAAEANGGGEGDEPKLQGYALLQEDGSGAKDDY